MVKDFWASTERGSEPKKAGSPSLLVDAILASGICHFWEVLVPSQAEQNKAAVLHSLFHGVTHGLEQGQRSKKHQKTPNYNKTQLLESSFIQL